ncbi:outer membrane protein assembly factor BamC [Vibrio vulnificus]|uniref:Outer membrane protein assembly factor BamC n=1 Tax=Vibrio vulnificus (strain CMCP6) TaxID=216895 RepID=A0A3Q0L4K9_VIBVU|nr:outer membrane protein assembly factor BamC [Vibrio vulnificus]AAO10314.1 Outer membrane protein NlpB, lipoprotein component of the protein assembly complex (forms a complex with YaeT, YfiO, and YfgL); Lipoprotein-34 precursor [Vibrio vulnificus CMCP6]ARN66637.1 outer membrane protein assembly factor BamC [Vibrio vulnificus]EGR0056626.1 outer membrane protein assembly factor BamC [Vibrio vulnificus]EGR0107888.1 outer membrane protein assembly factor BamC [Vibrio vulnificus]EGR0790773.1 oute
MKFSRQLVLSSLAVFVLSACSGSATQRRQAKDDFAYLETPPLEQWQLPEGATPQFYPNYNIPQGEFAGGIGKQVDIRPPQQILELIPGARYERSQGEVTLWLIKQEEADEVWQTVKDMLAERQIPIDMQSDTHIETGWVTWRSEDEEMEIGSRYAIDRFEANNRHGFKINLVDWREGTELKPVTLTNKERYNVFMTNLVTSQYDQVKRDEAQRRAQELVKQIPITMGTDRSGFPVIIARTPYNVLWQRLPTILPQMGFTIDERNQSQGTIKAKYASPDDEFWNEIGVKPMELKSGTYTFLFGDLGNRTSINVTDSSGKPVEEAFLKSMAPVLAAVVKKE